MVIKSYLHVMVPTFLSPQTTQFALCNGKVVTVQNPDSRAIVAGFHTDVNAQFCCFSPDGRLVAAAAGETAYVWDIASADPHLVRTFVGHGNFITSLIFSSPSSLISGSKDSSLRFWKIDASSADQAPITSVSLQARAGVAISSDQDGVVKIWDLLTGLHKETFQIPAAKNIRDGNGDAKLIDGRLVFAWYESGKIHIWDAGKKELAKTLDVPYPRGLRILGDGSKVILVHDKGIQAWHMWTWEPAGEVKLKDKYPYLDSLCTDGPRVWIRCKLSLAQEGWDFGVSGSSPVSFDPSTGRPHPDIMWDYRIKDTVTGKEVSEFRWKHQKPVFIQWDGQYLVAGYNSGELNILDFHHMLPQ